jgi:hypothetical protein
LDRLFRFKFLSDLLNYLDLFFLALMTLRLSVLIQLFQLNFVTLPLIWGLRTRPQRACSCHCSGSENMAVD